MCSAPASSRQLLPRDGQIAKVRAETPDGTRRGKRASAMMIEDGILEMIKEAVVRERATATMTTIAAVMIVTRMEAEETEIGMIMAALATTIMIEVVAIAATRITIEVAAIATRIKIEAVTEATTEGGMVKEGAKAREREVEREAIAIVTRTVTGIVEKVPTGEEEEEEEVEAWTDDTTVVLMLATLEMSLEGLMVMVEIHETESG